ncbi:MAG: hypothetical protein JSW12_12255 [Deltaproteobacteria bacterium]|nr:MAG: hypothetical protein JSW12_12255 [Deltaproteobacteria bacterium]
MKGNKKYLLVGPCALIIVVFLSGIAFSEEVKTITGKVNEIYQIVADDGRVYEISTTEKGDEVVGLIDQRVKVTGVLEESEGEKIINITSYEVLDE